MPNKAWQMLRYCLCCHNLLLRLSPKNVYVNCLIALEKVSVKDRTEFGFLFTVFHAIEGGWFKVLLKSF